MTWPKSFLKIKKEIKLSKCWKDYAQLYQNFHELTVAEGKIIRKWRIVKESVVRTLRKSRSYILLT